jgi:hypothetical protein
VAWPFLQKSVRYGEVASYPPAVAQGRICSVHSWRSTAPCIAFTVLVIFPSFGMRPPAKRVALNASFANLAREVS